MAAPFVFSFEVMGEQQIMRGFSRFADNVKDLREAFREIADDFHKGEAQQFQSQGGYGTGGWAPLAPSTIEHKQRGGYPLDILVRTGALRDAMVVGGPGAVEVIRPLEMSLGTTIEYARFHQAGTRDMPQRKIIVLPEEQKTRWHKIIHKYLVKQAKGAF